MIESVEYGTMGAWEVKWMMPGCWLVYPVCWQGSSASVALLKAERKHSDNTVTTPQQYH